MPTERQSGDDPAWLRFVILIFSNRARFRRFVVVLLIVIGAVLLAGWMWGGGLSGLAAAVIGVGRWLRAMFRR